MSWSPSQDQIYLIVQADSTAIQIGQIVYFQTGTFGAPKGLLLALTQTPLFVKMLKTSNGLQRIS